MLICLSLFLLLTSCGSQNNNHSNNLSEKNNNMISQYPDKKIDSSSNILIAYFTWAENTQVENPDEVDVDASTSASLLPPGNAAKIAGWIQQHTGGDLFSIVVAELYSSDYDECLDRAADEKAENARPKLKDHVENMDAYDVVFLGFPNWLAYHNLIQCTQV